MFFLPEQEKNISRDWEKIHTYLTLSKLGCPVFKSALIMPSEEISKKKICKLSEYFETNEVTVRYQYIHPNSSPIQGGNRYPLLQKELKMLQHKDTVLWILEPINRLKNDYGINLYFHNNCCIIEIVGKGFDVSDLNRGQISPHQSIMTELPVRWGYNNEWWKFLQYSFLDKKNYEIGKNRRTQKLKKMGYSISNNIFNVDYQPLPFDLLRELLTYISVIYDFMEINDYCVSCSVSEGRYIFWDIQTPDGKINRYGV